MAAITKVAPVLISPAGYESVQHGYATADFAIGDLVVFTTGAPATHTHAFAAAGAAIAKGVILKTVKLGGTAEACYVGEMGGYSGLTPSAQLTVASGVFDDAAPGAGQIGSASITATSATTIRFDLS